MEVTVFGKKQRSKDGKDFINYFGKLTKKTGEEITTQIKFKQEAGFPKNCPCVIEFDKKDANFTEKQKTYTDEKTQEQKETIERVLWVSNYTEKEYVDKSMDDFE